MTPTFFASIRLGLMKRFQGFLLFVALVISGLCLAPAQAQSIIRDAEIELTLREITDPLLLAAGLNPSDVDIIIINDPSLNAFVANGQKIHVFTGFLLEAETPSQLRGVLAHETGHISGGHLVRSRAALQTAMRPAYISIGLGVLAIAAGAPDAGAALIASSQQFAMLNFFVHTRTQESAADQAALTFLAAVGDDGSGLIEFFEKFRYQEVMSEARRFAYFRTHPLSSDRINGLQTRRAKLAIPPKVEDPKTAHGFAMMKAKLIGFLLTPAQVFSAYPKTDLSVPARYARTIAAYRAIDIGPALVQIDELLALEPDNPYFHELKGQILFENGQPVDSIPPHERSLELLPGQPLFQVNLARSLIARGTDEDLERAESLLSEALRTEPDNGFAWAELAMTYDRQGKNGEARLAIAEQAFRMGNYERAYIFARRAKDELTPATPQWQRADDISLTTDPKLEANRDRFRGFEAGSPQKDRRFVIEPSARFH
jgi:predicted Zn-dependent protease